MYLGWQAKRRPDAIAVIESGGRTVTYAELDARSRHLVAAPDLKPEDALAIRMPSGAAFLIERHRVTDAQFVPASRSSVRRSGRPARDRWAGRATTFASSTASSTEAEDFLGLPRDPSGKLRKGLLRETYWRNHESRIV
ncbi:hypothetical protein OG568_03450 [Streptomyces sp. NBC_01450]|uniref:hypothetical protein n=1 Tax=Streptomyces sp. NBC_01450 TaxID=2903871 RepID=UPI002E2F6D97|nr:hypothetical protein [Streptomyces sp. NBC_01450]